MIYAHKLAPKEISAIVTRIIEGIEDENRIRAIPVELFRITRNLSTRVILARDDLLDDVIKGSVSNKSLIEQIKRQNENSHFAANILVRRLLYKETCHDAALALDCLLDESCSYRVKLDFNSGFFNYKEPLRKFSSKEEENIHNILCSAVCSTGYAYFTARKLVAGYDEWGKDFNYIVLLQMVKSSLPGCIEMSKNMETALDTHKKRTECVLVREYLKLYRPLSSGYYKIDSSDLNQKMYLDMIKRRIG